MEAFNPLSSEVRAELAALSNRILDIENELIRVSQHRCADHLRAGRHAIFLALHQMQYESDRLAAPF